MLDAPQVGPTSIFYLRLGDQPLYRGAFGWFSPFAALCGVGLGLGYSLLGACWLVRGGATYRLIPQLSVGLLIFLIVVFGFMLPGNLRIIGHDSIGIICSSSL